jgi:uncharacterized protein (TIGR00156 family)
MKKRYILILALAVSLVAAPTLLCASVRTVNVAEALSLQEGQKVQLEGFITEKMHGDSYLFWDGSDQIILKTKKDILNDANIRLQNVVSIQGTVKYDSATKKMIIKVEMIGNIKIVEEDEDYDIFSEGVRDIEGR